MSLADMFKKIPYGAKAEAERMKEAVPVTAPPVPTGIPGQSVQNPPPPAPNLPFPAEPEMGANVTQVGTPQAPPELDEVKQRADRWIRLAMKHSDDEDVKKMAFYFLKELNGTRRRIQEISKPV